MPRRHPDTPPADGKEIRRLRMNAGYDPKELADLVDMSRATIFNLENNGPATPSVIRPLAEFFGVPRKQLINGTPPPEPPPGDNKSIFVGLVYTFQEDPDLAEFEDQLRAHVSNHPRYSPAAFYIQRFTRGSFVATIHADVIAFYCLLRAFNNAELRRLKVKRIDFHRLCSDAIIHWLSQQPVDDPHYDQPTKLSQLYPNLRFRNMTTDIITCRRRPLKKRVVV